MAALTQVLDALGSRDHERLSAALDALSKTDSPVDLAALAEATYDRMQAGELDEWERQQVLSVVAEAPFGAEALVLADLERVRRLLRLAVCDEDWLVRGWAAEAFTLFADQDDIATLRDLALDDPHPWVRSDAIDSLDDLSREALEQVVRQILMRDEEDFYVTTVASVYALAIGRHDVSLPSGSNLLTEDEVLLIRVMSTLRYLLLDTPRQPGLIDSARQLISSLERSDLPPIVGEECDLLVELV